MAQENITKFMEKLAADKTLQDQLKGKKADEVVALAAEMGFSFTKEELKDFAKGIKELTPEDIEQASGGIGSGLTDAINDARDGFTNGIGKIAEGAEWVGKNAKTTFKYISIVIESWFN